MTEIIVIQGDRRLTKLMQGFDMFEPWKIVAEAVHYEATLEGSIPRALTCIKEAIEAQGSRVAAIFIPNNKEGAWKDSSVRVISNGTHWGLLDDCLKVLGFIAA